MKLKLSSSSLLKDILFSSLDPDLKKSIIQFNFIPSDLLIPSLIYYPCFYMLSWYGLCVSVHLTRFTLRDHFVFQLDTEPDDPIKFLKSVEEEKKKEKERIARNVSKLEMIFSEFK